MHFYHLVLNLKGRNRLATDKRQAILMAMVIGAFQQNTSCEYIAKLQINIDRRKRIRQKLFRSRSEFVLHKFPFTVTVSIACSCPAFLLSEEYSAQTGEVKKRRPAVNSRPSAYNNIITRLFTNRISTYATTMLCLKILPYFLCFSFLFSNRSFWFGCSFCRCRSRRFSRSCSS